MNTTKSGLIGLVILVLSIAAGSVFAASGQVQNLSGTLSAQRPDGSVRILSQKSEVNAGDVLTTQRDSYVQINFTDGSSMTMRPNTQMKIERYQFDEAKPQEDNAFFRLVKGGLRTVTGLVGKRGNQDAYRIGTATATIGIRGSSGDTLDCTSPEGCAGVVAGGEKLESGVYHTTFTGSYIMFLGTDPDIAQRPGVPQIIIGEGQFGVVRNSSTPPQLTTIPQGINLIDLPSIGNPLLNRQGATSCSM